MKAKNIKIENTDIDIENITNRQIAEIIFNNIRSYGFEPYNIEYGNSYFIIEFDEDSIVHFRLKGVWKGFKFGMWIKNSHMKQPIEEEKKEFPPSDLDKVVSVFCQHDDWIDKFKPSRSAMCVSISRDEIIEENFYYSLESMLKMIKRHPLMCYDEYCGNNAGFHEESFILPFLKCHYGVKIRELDKNIKRIFFYNYTKFKLFFAKRDKNILSIKLEDFEKENPGWSTDYLYKVIPTFKKVTSDEDIFKWYYRWFRKEKYGEFKYYSCVVESSYFKMEDNDKYYYIADCIKDDAESTKGEEQTDGNDTDNEAK